jgi:acyl carrier protein
VRPWLPGLQGLLEAAFTDDCNADLLVDGILDSLKFAELLLLLERQFSIHVNVNAFGAG